MPRLDRLEDGDFEHDLARSCVAQAQFVIRQHLHDARQGLGRKLARFLAQAGGLGFGGFDPEFAAHIALVDAPKTRNVIQTKLAELGHPDIQLKFIEADRPQDSVPVESTPAPAPVTAVLTPRSATPAAEPPPSKPAKARPESVAFSQDDFKNDPLIQKALEIFKGQIVEVRA